MPGLEILIPFFMATAVFAYLPGPAMLYATAQTLSGGQRAGWMAALGIHLGGYVHVIAAASGLAILFQYIPTLYTVLKLLGAAYLVFLGVQLIAKRASPHEIAEPAAEKSARRAFWNSVTVEVLNPKTALFFVAFLPQFSDPSAALPVWAQLVILGTIVNVMFSSADVICVLAAAKISSAMRRSQKTQIWAQRVAGSLLVGLGANLALGRD